MRSLFSPLLRSIKKTTPQREGQKKKKTNKKAAARQGTRLFTGEKKNRTIRPCPLLGKGKPAPKRRRGGGGTREG